MAKRIPTATFMVGVPASGKTIIAMEMVRANPRRAVDDLVTLALPQVHLELALALPDHVLVGHVLDPAQRSVRKRRVADAVVGACQIAERFAFGVLTFGLGLIVVVGGVFTIGLDERAQVDGPEADSAELGVAVPVEDLVNGDVGDLGAPLTDHGVDRVQLLELQIVHHGGPPGQRGVRQS